MNFDLSNPFWSELCESHREWLTPFHVQHLKNWEKLLKSAPESALCEAAVRRFLMASGLSVSPNETLDGSSQSPDFRCQRGVAHFYVEVRSISVQQATEITGLSNDGAFQSAINPTPLTNVIFEICKEKATQCSCADGPVMLAIATAHSAAAMLSFSPPFPDMVLCGKTTMTVLLNSETLKSEEGIQLDSELYSAAFLKPDRGSGIEAARKSISGVLLCGITLGSCPIEMWVVGLLHPNPTKQFDPHLLPNVTFGRVEVKVESGQLRTQWPNGSGQ